MVVRHYLVLFVLSITLYSCGISTTVLSPTAIPQTSVLSTSTPSTAVPITPTEIQERQVPGIIDYYQESQTTVVSAPETVKVNAPFELEISTYGSGCERSGGANVNIVGLRAEVEVYDYTTRDLVTACTAELIRLTRSVTLVFAETGEAQIIVQGVRVGPETSSMDGIPTTLERTIIVQ